MHTVEFGRIWKNDWMRDWRCEVYLDGVEDRVELTSPFPDGFDDRPSTTEKGERAWYAHMRTPGGRPLGWDEPMPLRVIKRRLVDFYANEYDDIAANDPTIIVTVPTGERAKQRCTSCGKWRVCEGVLNEEYGIPNNLLLRTWTEPFCYDCMPDTTVELIAIGDYMHDEPRRRRTCVTCGKRRECVEVRYVNYRPRDGYEEQVGDRWSVWQCQQCEMRGRPGAGDDADRRAAEYAAVLERLAEEQEEEMERRVWQPLSDAVFRIADRRGWPIEYRWDLLHVVEFVGYRMGGDDAHNSNVMALALDNLSTQYDSRIYNGDEMASHEQMVKDVIAFIKRAEPGGAA